MEYEEVGPGRKLKNPKKGKQQPAYFIRKAGRSRLRRVGNGALTLRKGGTILTGVTWKFYGGRAVV